MQEALINFEQHIFEFNKHPLRIESRSAAILTCAESASCNDLNDIPNGKVFASEHWTTRGSRVDAIFDIAFAPDLHLETSKVKQLGMILQQSIVEAEFWKQLGLQASTSTNSGGYVDECNKAQFTIVLRGFEQFLEKNNGFLILPSRGRDICNVRPPVSVPMYQLKSIHITMAFNSKVDDSVSRKMHESARLGIIDDAYFVKLADASLRSFLSSRPLRYRGRKMVSSWHQNSLPDVAPSIFIPEYAQRIAARADLIEPIARFLAPRRAQLAAQVSRKNLPGTVEQDAAVNLEQLRVDLWTTMKNALQHQGASRTLKPMKRPTTTSSVRTECDCEDDIQDCDYAEDYTDMEMLSLQMEDIHDSLDSTRSISLHTDDLQSRDLFGGSTMTPASPPNILAEAFDDESSGSVLHLEHLDDLLLHWMLEDDHLGFESLDDGIGQNLNHDQTCSTSLDGFDSPSSEYDIMDLDVRLRSRHSSMSLHQMLLDIFSSDEMFKGLDTSRSLTAAGHHAYTHHMDGDAIFHDVAAPEETRGSTTSIELQQNTVDYLDMLV